MPMLTDAAIRGALATAARTGKARTLTDAGRRGEGRLLAMVRPMPAGPLLEFYARQITGKSRRLVKLGSWPTMTLAAARMAFRDLAPVIREGDNIKAHRDRRRAERAQLGTLRELCEAYAEHLERARRRSAPEVRRCLLDAPGAAARVIGPEVLACDVTGAHVAAWLRPIHRRGSQTMADQARRWLSAAFNWASRHENDYRTEAAKARRWAIAANPAALVPVDTAARRAGTRHLSRDEWAAVWRWLGDGSAGRTDGRACAALRLLMLTGQRVEEVLGLRREQYAAGWLRWEDTKAGRRTGEPLPHSIPLPPQAVPLLEALEPNRWGLYFPGLKYPREPFRTASLDWITRRCAEALAIPPFCPRDLRRTWTTLAMDAGLSSEECARVQNHATGPRTQERHYNRSQHEALKVEAMRKWAGAVSAMLDGMTEQPKAAA